MAFAEANGTFDFNYSTFIDKSKITTNTYINEREPNGRGLQILLNASSTEASFDSEARHPPPLCHPSTRTGLLEYIFQWIDAGEEDFLFLDGPAGAGKSAVAQTVAERSEKRKILVASYFFFRGSPSRNTIVSLVPSLAYQMGTSTLSARMRTNMEKAINDDPSILHKSSEVQLQKLILEPLQPPQSTWTPTANQKRYLLIIDGLDECNGEQNQRRIASLLGQLVSNKHLTLRCLITSRPEPPIISAVTSLPTRVMRATLDGQSWNDTGDIRTYLLSGFLEISSRMGLLQLWPSDEVTNTLVMKAGGMFIYASTVLKYVGDPDELPTKKLEHVLHLSPGTSPFAELDQLYQQILMACLPKHRPTLLHIFGFIFLQNPALEKDFDVSIIEALLGLSPGEVAVVLRKMHSILAIGTSGTKHTIHFLHASFGDFIFNQERSGPFFIDPLKKSLFLAEKCIDYLGYHEERDSQVKSIYDVRTIYAWSSWYYHGEKASDSYSMHLAEKLRCCDKMSWVKSCRRESLNDVLISELLLIGRSKLSDVGLTNTIIRLESIFENIDQYREFLNCEKSTSQSQLLLDLFQQLLEIPALEPQFRRNLVIATQRLMMNTNLYPNCAALEDVGYVDDHLVATAKISDIYKGHLKDKKFHVRVMKVHESRINDEMKAFYPHAILWGQLSHPNLLPFYGPYRFQDRLRLVSPWVENGDIHDYLQQNPRANRTLLALDTATGISYLHANDITHGNLKGNNILVDHSGRAQVCLSSMMDFKSERQYPATMAPTNPNPRWAAPELWDSESDTVSVPDSKSDIYAWACVCYEIFTGLMPFFELRNVLEVRFEVRQGIRPLRPSAMSEPRVKWGLTEAIWSLMEDCWKHYPTQRPSADYIVAQLSSASAGDTRPTGGWGEFHPAQQDGVWQPYPSITDLDAMLWGHSTPNDSVEYL